MSPSRGDETYVLDACVVIDFCGRTDNLRLLLSYVGDEGVVTSQVLGELERQRKKHFPRLGTFLDLLKDGVVRVVDPDLADDDVGRILRTWSSQFGSGEVSSAALAISHRWVFVSRDHAPMRELHQRETMKMQSTRDVLDSLVRVKSISKSQGERIMKEILSSGKRRR
jgi:predicted nucleic acid-binding protein